MQLSVGFLWIAFPIIFSCGAVHFKFTLILLSLMTNHRIVESHVSHGICSSADWLANKPVFRAECNWGKMAACRLCSSPLGHQSRNYHQEERFSKCASVSSGFFKYNLCSYCLGEDHARAVLESSECAHCEKFTMRMLCSCLSLFSSWPKS